jgi:hypothetical protein
MADPKNQTGLDAATSVSALGLRWAALRGMLGSPLIEADEQKQLRDDLVRELQAIERDFSAIAARSPIEIAAKIDVVKTALRQNGLDEDGWITSLLDSVQIDIRTAGATGSGSRPERPPMHLSRAAPVRNDHASAPGVGDAEQPAA